MPDLLDQIADQSASSAKPADLLDQVADNFAKQQPSAADSLKPYKPTISERIAPAVVSAAGGAEKVVEPFTPAGMLNQPTRLVGAISKSLGGGQIADPFVAGQSLLKDIPEPQGKGYGAGLGRLGIGILKGLTTPESIVTLPAATQSAIVRFFFAGQMLYSS